MRTTKLARARVSMNSLGWHWRWRWRWRQALLVALAPVVGCGAENVAAPDTPDTTPPAAVVDLVATGSDSTVYRLSDTRDIQCIWLYL